MKARTISEKETLALAASLAEHIAQRKWPIMIGLSGPLGGGKSVLARGLIRKLVHNETAEIPSPTFTLVQTYDSPFGPIYHFDLYRLKETAEIYELGWEEACAHGLCLVEWPERLGTLKPRLMLDMTIVTSQNDPDTREIELIDPSGAPWTI